MTKREVALLNHTAQTAIAIVLGEPRTGYVLEPGEERKVLIDSREPCRETVLLYEAVEIGPVFGGFDIGYSKGRRLL